MKCQSCKEDITVKMKKALKSNECPYCGSEILNVEKMQQFNDLQEVLGLQKFTDSEVYDSKIRDKVIRVLMEQMKCVRIEKEQDDDDDIVRISVEASSSGSSEAQITRKLSNADQLIDQQANMREEMYREVVEGQYSDNLPEESEPELLDEDKEAARDVVFSEGATSDKAQRLKSKAPLSVKNKPIQRIE